MEFKKSMILIILTVFLFAIAAASASDVNDMTLASEDAGQVELSSDIEIDEDNLQANNDNTAGAETDSEIFGAGNGTYNDLRNDIGSGGDKTLTKSYYRWTDSSSGSIEITTSGVINGNGAVIDMAGSPVRAFYVTCDGVTLKNLTIKNANYFESGGAIQFTKSGTLENCNFINNRATGNSGGGALWFGGQGTVKNCNFINNAANNGGAVQFTNTGTLENCNFTSNSAIHAGGAVYFDDQGTVINCNFVNNAANEYGGAIMFLSSCTVENCNVINNTANNGGAISASSGGTVKNCNFTNNKATPDYNYGGAIRMYGKGTVENCNFTKNSARQGGAVWFYGDSIVKNCQFSDNSVDGRGGAVAYHDEFVANVENCTFTNNKVSGYQAGAIYFNSGSVKNSVFTGNHAKESAGAVYCDSGTLENCNFTNNAVSEWFGGAVIFNGNANLVNCNFIGNTAPQAAAVFFFGDVVISNSSFLNNRADADTLRAVQMRNNITITFTGKNNFLNAFCSNRAITVTNVTYWGANGKITNTGNSTVRLSGSNLEAGQNISVYGVVNGTTINRDYVTDSEGKIVLENITGDYIIFIRHAADSYYTEAKKTISNMNFYVNITSLTTTNKTVNITAKSNLPDIINGELLFIVPGSDPIIASFDGNETWWAVHAFDDYAEYKVDARVGVDYVKVNAANITVIRADSTIVLDDVVLNYGDLIKVNVTTDGALAITAMIDDEDIGVIKYEIPISGLNAGIHTLTVTTIPDNDHVAVTKTVNITVNILETSLSGVKVTTTYGTSKNLVITLKDVNANPLAGKNVTVVLGKTAYENITTNSKGEITIAVAKNLDPKTYTASITFDGDTNYVKSAGSVNVEVKKATPKLTAAKKTFKKSAKTKKYTVTLKTDLNEAMKKVKVTLKVKGKKYVAKTNSKGKATFKIKNLKKKGTYKATVTYNGNNYYNAVTKKNVKIIVK